MKEEENLWLLGNIKRAYTSCACGLGLSQPIGLDFFVEVEFNQET